MTLSFFGSDPSNMLNCPLINDGIFKEDAHVSVTLRAFLLVPYKILTALVSIDDPSISSSNDFAHITLMRGEWKPVQSNNILKALFNDKYGLKRDMYEDIMSSSSNYSGYVEKMLVNMQREGEVECYLVVP